MGQPKEDGVPSLREALRRARSHSAERSGVLVELRTAEMARLDLLKERLEPVFKQVPDTVDLFDGAILPGDPARLFVDVLGFVEMGRDKRTYQFFQDTRHGRQLLGETEDLASITQIITDYVAYRIVEREKALAADPSPDGMRRREPEQPQAREGRRSGTSDSMALLIVLALIAAVGAFWLSGFVWQGRL
jgi:hypothetical protein